MTISFSGNLIIGSNTWVSDAQLKFGFLSIGPGGHGPHHIIIWNETDEGGIIGPVPVEWETDYIEDLLNGKYIVLNEWE